MWDDFFHHMEQLHPHDGYVDNSHDSDASDLTAPLSNMPSSHDNDYNHVQTAHLTAEYHIPDEYIPVSTSAESEIFPDDDSAALHSLAAFPSLSASAEVLFDDHLDLFADHNNMVSSSHIPVDSSDIFHDVAEEYEPSTASPSAVDTWLMHSSCDDRDNSQEFFPINHDRHIAEAAALAVPHDYQQPEYFDNHHAIQSHDLMLAEPDGTSLDLGAPTESSVDSDVLDTVMRTVGDKVIAYTDKDGDGFVDSITEISQSGSIVHYHLEGKNWVRA